MGTEQDSRMPNDYEIAEAPILDNPRIVTVMSGQSSKFRRDISAYKLRRQLL